MCTISTIDIEEREPCLSDAAKDILFSLVNIFYNAVVTLN